MGKNRRANCSCCNTRVADTWRLICTQGAVKGVWHIGAQRGIHKWRPGSVRCMIACR